jgi:signal transduction histidine kinase
MLLKKIRVEMTATDDAVVEMNDVLAEALVSNLLSNAVRFNIDNGFIKCYIDSRDFSITNSGLPLTINPDNLFKRFYKGTDNPQSVGLGLSIVKKITEGYGMSISYIHHDNAHEIRLRYRNKKK